MSIEAKLEVVALPVSDVERAKRFYGGLGWRLDADFVVGPDFRVVQFTPPGSPCSIHIGKGVTKAAPGSAQGLFLVVTDLDSARTELLGHGVDVSPVIHFDGEHRPVPGPDPDRRSYFSYASFRDPDGNAWVLQEVKTRLPGRGVALSLANLTELLQDAEKRHGDYGPTAPKHHWSVWYAAYVLARADGRTSEEAFKDAALHVQRTLDSAPR